MYKIFIIFLSLLLCSLAPASSALLSYAQDMLSHQGILQQTNSLVYIDIDDAYIHQLISFIHSEGFEEPPYFGHQDRVGAHITVIYPDEMTAYNITKIKECGEIVSFSLGECRIVHPPRWHEVEELFLVTVEAPAINCLRQKYGLPEREHAYHITIGIKPKLAKAS